MMGGGWIGWVALVSAVFANIGANLLLRYSMKAGSGQAAGGGDALVRSFPTLAIGLFLAALLLVSYLITLRHLPVNVAYPVVTGVSLIGIAVFSAVFLAEALRLVQVIGVASILIGTVLVIRG